MGAVVVGVSRDGADAQRAFAAKYALPYLLVADVDGAVGKAVGVPSIAGYYDRVTVLAAPDGRIAHVFHDVDVKRHAEQVIARIRAAPAPAP